MTIKYHKKTMIILGLIKVWEIILICNLEITIYMCDISKDLKEAMSYFKTLSLAMLCPRWCSSQY